MNTQVATLTSSPPQPLPFAPSLHMRAFVLQRAEGNLLVYSTDGLRSAISEPIARQYLNHVHEAMFSADPVGAPVFIHEVDQEVGEGLHVRGTFSRRHTLDHDFEVIPTPGHTPGATVYLWDDGDRRHLFTGDSIYLREGEWVAAMLNSSDREAYLESLELIRDLEFDVLVPWAATAGGPFHAGTDKADTHRRIDAIIRRLRQGDDH